jgi:hypothetical protein
MAKHEIASRRTSFKIKWKTSAIEDNDSIGDLSDKFWVTIIRMRINRQINAYQSV